jgi:hypothetical protein
LSLVAGAAQAQSQSPPAIANISPSTSPTAGGVDVTITGTNLQPHIECILPCPTTVTFGDATVQAYRVTDTEITVKTPAHATATVDVTVTVPGGGSTTAANAFTFSDSAPELWEPILIPVYIGSTTPGEHGSIWRTILWIQNTGSQTLDVAPWPCTLPPGACAAPFPESKPLAPGQSLLNLDPSIYGSFPEPGRIIYLNRAASNDAAINLRVLDDSGIAVDSGTEVPVVRERNLLTAPTRLINVPVLNNRLLLRIYDLSSNPAQFHVRVVSLSETPQTVPLVETTLTAVAFDDGPFHVTPDYAEFPIEINVNGPILLPKDAAVSVEITPLTPGSRYWAFVSATNNTTNHVTLVTPQ